MTDGCETGPWLLVSDVDDTLTGDDAALTFLGRALCRHRDCVRVVLNSSRPARSVARTRAEVFPRDLPVDAVITALGTEIALGDADLPQWSSRFSGWPHDAIFQTVAGFGHRPHDPEFQTPLKISFSVPPDARAAVAAALAAQNLPSQIIASGASDLDIIPPGAGKGAAALFLAQHIGIGRDRLIAAGDSGNDLALFAIAAKAIAVGNARPELLTAMRVDHNCPNCTSCKIGSNIVHSALLDRDPDHAQIGVLQLTPAPFILPGHIILAKVEAPISIDRPQH